MMDARPRADRNPAFVAEHDRPPAEPAALPGIAPVAEQQRAVRPVVIDLQHGPVVGDRSVE